MHLQIVIPPSYREERLYVCRYVLERRLNLQVEYKIAGEDARQTTISDGGPASIAIPDVLFAVPATSWLGPACYPDVKILDGDDVAGLRDVAVLFPTGSKNRTAADRTGSGFAFNFDILGGIFFLLSGMEQLICGEQDEHGRLPGPQALVSRHQMEHRPVVDEAIAYLAACLNALWPGIAKPGGSYAPRPSHDLDFPFRYHGLPAAGVVRQLGQRLAGDVLYRKSAASILETLQQFSRYVAGGGAKDPNLRIRQLMDISEAHDLQSCFYVIVDPQHPLDGRRYIDDPLILEALKEISLRGHAIGLHASYATYDNPEQAAKETAILRELLDKLGIQQNVLGIRHHFLRWPGPQQWRIWDDAGMDYDASLGFSDRFGFRCGTSHSFPIFDLKSHKQLAIEERPLIAMDGTFRPASAGEWRRRGKDIIGDLSTVIDGARLHKGSFELLWHNTELQSAFLRQAYQKVLQTARPA